MKLLDVYIGDLKRSRGGIYEVRAYHDADRCTADLYCTMSPIMISEIEMRPHEYRVSIRGDEKPIIKILHYPCTDNECVIVVDMTDDEWNALGSISRRYPKICAAAGAPLNPESDRSPIGFIQGDFDAVNLS